MDANQVNFWIQQGPWALLFVSLLVYVIKDSRMREKKYQDTIDKLVDKLSIVDAIKADIEELKKYFKGDGKK
jgi:hypothetical protein